jgi:hypothetical protein
MKIGLDIHGVIDAYPEILAKLSKKWVEAGHPVYIITGQPRNECERTVQDAGITYTDFFSIVDHHLAAGTTMWDDDVRGKGWWMNPEDWLPTKGVYARRVGLHVHFDDSPEYRPYFPRTCSFVLVEKGFGNLLSLML